MAIGGSYEQQAIHRRVQDRSGPADHRGGYPVREVARRDIFDYIEMFYNPIRRHGHNDGLSPVEFEKQYFMQAGSV